MITAGRFGCTPVERSRGRHHDPLVYKVQEFRKRNTPDWHECKYSSRHMLVPGHERMEKELRQIRERIAESGKSGDEDLKRLGALEAVKNAESDEDDEKGRLTAVADGMITEHAYIECDPDGAFFWVRSGESWDLLRHDDGVVAEMIQAEYFRKYGVVAGDYYVTIRADCAPAACQTRRTMRGPRLEARRF